MTSTGVLEKPLPKPRRDPLAYASARAAEALVEATVALTMLDEGMVRNAAGKMFQAWRALTASLLALSTEKLRGRVDERWLRERAIPRAAATRLKQLSRLVEEAHGLRHYSALVDKALDLHDYQYHGPDPDLELSKYRDPGEAAEDILYLADELASVARERLRPLLSRHGAWTGLHEEALAALEEKLRRVRGEKTGEGREA